MSKFCPACGGTATQPRPGCTNDKHADYGYCADCLEPLTAHAGDCPAVVPHPRAVDIVGDGFRCQDHDGTRRHDWTLTINVGSLTVDEAHDLSEHLLGVIVRRHEGCPVAAATGGPWPPSNRRNPLAAGQRDA